MVPGSLCYQKWIDKTDGRPCMASGSHMQESIATQTHVATRSSCPLLLLIFASTHMPPTFLEHIHQLSALTILNKMGLHCHLPCRMVFVPHELGGVRLCNLIHEQRAQQLVILLCHLQAKTVLGTALRTTHPNLPNLDRATKACP